MQNCWKRLEEKKIYPYDGQSFDLNVGTMKMSLIDLRL